jgi:putative Mn2+ efflux pump MntP
MNIFSTAILAFSMSTDAFAVSLGKGAGLHRPKIRDAFRTGAIFGTVEAMTPVVGWLAGLAAGEYVAAVDHWIAFAVLGLIGCKMLLESLREREEEEKPRRHGIGVLLTAAIGTSIDSFAIGITLSILGASIWGTAAAIGLVTCLMVTIGIMAGHYLGNKMGRIAESAGGMMLIAIGTKILCDHLHVFNLHGF